MITRALVVIATVTALTYATRTFVPRGTTVTGSGAALAFGFLLIVAIQASHIFDKLRLPHLTAYILCGLVFGPEVLGLVSAKMLPDLAIVKGTAVGLIALLAGCELNLARLRPRLRAIGAVSAFTIGCAVLLLFPLFYAITHLLPISGGFSTMERIAVALVCANVLAAFSPAVVVGLISETKASGPLSEAAMSIVVLADLVIVVTYALSSTFANSVFTDSGTAGSIAMLAPHIFGSVLAGAVLGAILALYTRRVRTRTGMFTFALLFISAEAGAALHLNPLLVGLAAGLFLENLSPVGGDHVSRAAESVAMPTFAIFFAVIGAEVHLAAFLHVAPFAIAAALLRAAGIFAGTHLAARTVAMDRALARRLPFGLLPQAGVAIALASLVLSGHGAWGAVFGTVLLGTIVVNELIAPVLFRNALVAAGEVRAPISTPEPGPPLAPDPHGHPS